MKMLDYLKEKSIFLSINAIEEVLLIIYENKNIFN